MATSLDRHEVVFSPILLGPRLLRSYSFWFVTNFIRVVDELLVTARTNRDNLIPRVTSEPDRRVWGWHIGRLGPVGRVVVPKVWRKATVIKLNQHVPGAILHELVQFHGPLKLLLNVSDLSEAMVARCTTCCICWCSCVPTRIPTEAKKHPQHAMDSAAGSWPMPGPVGRRVEHRSPSRISSLLPCSRACDGRNVVVFR